MAEIATRFLKYFLEGLAVAGAMVIIPRKMPSWEEVFIVSITAALMFAILDLLSPSVGLTARQGAGFGLGAKFIGWPSAM